MFEALAPVRVNETWVKGLDSGTGYRLDIENVMENINTKSSKSTYCILYLYMSLSGRHKIDIFCHIVFCPVKTKKIRYDRTPITEMYLQPLKDKLLLVCFCKVLPIKCIF